MYTLLLVTTQTFLGQYQTLDSCNQAIRAIFEKQLIPYPQYLDKNELRELQKAVDLKLQYQRQYLCVKQ